MKPRYRLLLRRVLVRVLPGRVLDFLLVKYWRFRNSQRAYELETDQLSGLVHEGDWVVDVGVNMGQYASRLQELVGENGCVIGFEASAATFRLSRRILSDTSVKLHNLALGNEVGSVTLARYADSAGMINHGISRITELPVDAAETETVQAVRLDDFLGDRDRPIVLIKCDVEGFEPQVLAGSMQLIEKDRPAILVEIMQAENFKTIADKLLPLGYVVKQYRAGEGWVVLSGFDQRWRYNFLFVLGDIQQ